MESTAFLALLSFSLVRQPYYCPAWKDELDQFLHWSHLLSNLILIYLERGGTKGGQHFRCYCYC